jgi:A/G-specific adenine glycosylase
MNRPYKAEESLPVIPCGVAIIRRDKSFLISQRMQEDSFGSLWEFPGGKKNRGETFEECVVREVNEEIGIKVMVHEKFMEMRRTYHEKIIWLNFYLCTVLSGEPKPVECQRVLWADLERLSDFDFPPANEQVIQKLVEVFG